MLGTKDPIFHSTVNVTLINSNDVELGPWNITDHFLYGNWYLNPSINSTKLLNCSLSVSESINLEKHARVDNLCNLRVENLTYGKHKFYLFIEDDTTVQHFFWSVQVLRGGPGYMIIEHDNVSCAHKDISYNMSIKRVTSLGCEYTSCQINGYAMHAIVCQDIRLSPYAYIYIALSAVLVLTLLLWLIRSLVVYRGIRRWL